MKTLIERARKVGFKKIYNVGCYEDNIASHKMLLAVGFVLVEYNKEKKRLVHEIIL